MRKKPTVLILYPKVPFARGGTELLAESLCDRLRNMGCAVDILTLPFRWDPKEILIKEILNWRLLDLDADMVIPLKFPAYCVKHPNKVIYLLHQMRQLYDLHGTKFSTFSNNLPDSELREQLVHMDMKCLSEARSIYTIAKNISGRLKKFNNIDSKVLYPVSIYRDQLKTGEYGDYIFTVSRLEEYKRFDLLLRAIAETKASVRAVIAGKGPYLETLEKLAADLKITDRVEFKGFVETDQLIDLYANCCAVHYAPLDEDYGFVTMEAMLSGKPVITATDSGGPLEFIKDGENGIVVEPDPQQHAKALDTLWQDRVLCKNLGITGKKQVDDLHWDTVTDELMTWLK